MAVTLEHREAVNAGSIVLRNAAAGDDLSGDDLDDMDVAGDTLERGCLGHGGTHAVRHVGSRLAARRKLGRRHTGHVGLTHRARHHVPEPHDVRAIARSNGAEAAQAVVARYAVRRGAIDHLGLAHLLQDLTQHVVDMALAGDVQGVTIVGAETEAGFPTDATSWLRPVVQEDPGANPLFWEAR